MSGDKIKQLFVKHIEKMVFGLVALFALLILAGAQWSTYQKTALQLTQDLETADRLIATSNWSAEEQANFPLVEIDEEVNQMLAGINDSPYRWPTETFYNPAGRDDPRRKPELLAVVQLKADSGRTILAQQNEVALASDSDSDPAMSDGGVTPTKTSDQPEDLTPDDVSARPTTPTNGLGSEYSENPYAATNYVEEIQISDSYNEMVAGYSGSYSEEGMSTNLPSNVKGVPVRYISVRGVFDLRKQVLNYSRALSISETEAERLVEFLDFKLERQSAPSTNGPWGEWEPVDITVATDYLQQTVDFDTDVVSAGVRDRVITMPLPARLIGVWRNKANHPAVKNFELSPEEIEAEQALNRKILEDLRAKNQTIKQRAAPGGFASLQLDVTSMQQSYFEENTDMNRIDRSFSKDEFEGTPAEVRKKLIEKIKAQVSAAGNLVLFRYIDFDIEAGKAYRYRVQLVLRNPNFDAPIDQLVDPAIALDEILETPMSDPSDVATVSSDYEYFVKRVNPPRGISGEIADLEIFQWYDSGTMVRGNLSIEPGEYIAGTDKTYVLRPADLKYEEEPDVQFKTSDVVVDAVVISKLDYNLHKDLVLPKNLTRGEVGVVPEVLVVDGEGTLKDLDPISREALHGQYAKYYEDEKKPFEGIKDAGKKVTEGSALDSLLGSDGSMDSEMMMMYQEMDAGATRLQNRRRNPSRRSAPPNSGSSSFSSP
ncbi:MAG: hypothetical protein KDA78_02200 [Planctomycetaceae bacterium]|nr:hypothetical protein [Planctomycetaceae bacterium]